MKRSLSKQEIVRKKTDIDNMFRTGKAKSVLGLKLVIAPNALEVSRVIVIPVHGYGNSVERNRIRRQIKEIFRLEKDRLREGLDFGFIVYPGKVLTYERLKDDIQTLFASGGAYKSASR